VGYTHYWYRKNQTFNPSTYAKFSADCEKVCRASEIGLAGWDGTREPVFSETEVTFNGRQDCNHKKQDLGITWPGRAGQKWPFGEMIEQRMCGGNCSHETFRVDLDLGSDGYKSSDGQYFTFCKTAFKPYDICVTACLIVLEHYFKDHVRVSSDGESAEWDDARRLCQQVLGYGEEFTLPQEEEEN